MRTCAIIHPLHLELETALYNKAAGSLNAEAYCFSTLRWQTTENEVRDLFQQPV
jgi:hypothetical protein